jgi:SOS-response transcriptional repressor LexA
LVGAARACIKNATDEQTNKKKILKMRKKIFTLRFLVYYPAMHPTKEQIKEWLKRFHHSREWLGKQCGGVSKRAVDNWLSSPREIPESTLYLIVRLMEDDRVAEEERLRSGDPPQSHLVLRLNVDEFEAWNRAALAKRQIVTDWAVSAIRAAYEAELRLKAPGVFHVSEPVPFPDPARLPHNVIEIPLYGSVAAGIPSGPLDVSDGTHSVPRDLIGKSKPADLYVLRINGESMEPEYRDGHFILCRRLRDGEYAKKGQDVIASDASGAYFKRLEYRKEGKKGDTPRKALPKLVSINPDYPEVVPVADCPIVAVVVSKL